MVFRESLLFIGETLPAAGVQESVHGRRQLPGKHDGHAIHIHAVVVFDVDG